MIYSDRQYQVSQSQLAKLKVALDKAKANRNTESWLKDIELDALQSQISDIESEIAEYALLKTGQITLSETSALSELPRVLIQARIAKGISQTELAERLNMKPQQIQRYEASNYMSASLARLIEIANTLEVKISESFETPGSRPSGSIFQWADPTEIAWSRLPVKEMIKRNWFEVSAGQSWTDAVREFFLSNAGPQFASALHRKKMRGTNVPNGYALLAWQARVLSVARNLCREDSLGSFELNDAWLSELVKLTRTKNGPALARQMLLDRGIVVVIEEHLPGTYLDGASMLLDTGNPIVALTLRYDRLDNFWFVLFHELGHVFLHLYDGLKFDFFDEEDGSEADDLEKEADQFALDTLVPPELWDQCLSRFAITEEAVRLDAERLGVDASIIAGRIRKERNNYLILNSLVGQNTVRSQFEELEK